ncbi:class I SAM-dependent methyltransferase [Candidatus Saccharibacteria bacterium]|nr:class I SAM-dependent methyltransferase [Candidatus Saccharibacteria bacterium]
MISAEVKTPVTRNSSEFLADKHGFESLETMAEYFETGANVLDVGSGLSPLLGDLARLRPDVNFFTCDITDYPEKATPSRENLAHIRCDATKLANYFEAESVDAVFSYRLFHHLTPEQVYNSAKNIYQIAKPDAMISIGQKMGVRQQIDFNPAIHFDKSSKTPHEFSTEVLEGVGLSKYWSRMARCMINGAMSEFGPDLTDPRELRGVEMLKFGAKMCAYLPKAIHHISKSGYYESLPDLLKRYRNFAGGIALAGVGVAIAAGGVCTIATGHIDDGAILMGPALFGAGAYFVYKNRRYDRPTLDNTSSTTNP